MTNVSSIAPPSPSSANLPVKALERPSTGPATPFRTLLQRPGKQAAAFPSARSIPAVASGRSSAAEHAGAPADDASGKGKRVESDDDQALEDRPPGHRRDADLLDPLTRVLLGDGSPNLALERSGILGSATPSSPATRDSVSVAAHVSLENVMTRFVRKVAWSGDAHTGTARLELGAGALAGATLTIHSEQGAVRISLELPPGVDAAQWRERIARRLDARGLQVASLDVE